MLFDTNDVTVSMVPAPRSVHLVGVSYAGGSVGVMAELQGSVKDGVLTIKHITIGEVVPERKGHGLSVSADVDKLCSFDDNVSIFITRESVGHIVYDGVKLRRGNVTLLDELSGEFDLSRFYSLEAALIYRLSTDCNEELSQGLRLMLGVNPDGQWAIPTSNRHYYHLFAMAVACCEFYKQLDEEAKHD